MLQNEELAAKLGNARSRSTGLIGTTEAARLLGVNAKSVRALAHTGQLTGSPIEIARPTLSAKSHRPLHHPWVWAEALRRAELSGWKSPPSVRTRTGKRNVRRAGNTKLERRRVWRFRRADVLQFRDKRAAEQGR